MGSSGIKNDLSDYVLQARAHNLWLHQVRWFTQLSGDWARSCQYHAVYYAESVRIDVAHTTIEQGYLPSQWE